MRSYVKIYLDQFYRKASPTYSEDYPNRFALFYPFKTYNDGSVTGLDRQSLFSSAFPRILQYDYFQAYNFDGSQGEIVSANTLLFTYVFTLHDWADARNAKDANGRPLS